MARKRSAKKTLKVKRNVLISPRKVMALASVRNIPALAHLDLEWLGYLLAAWAFVMAGLFSLPNYLQLLPQGYPFGNLPTRWMLLGGFVALTVLWRIIPAQRDDALDFSPWITRFCFWLLMALGAALRLHRPEEPANFFWDDHYVIVCDIRAILDLKVRPLLFPFGWREPLYPYLSALLWSFIPHATGVFILRLSSTVIDLTSLWIFYLLGKEIGGRRMGILLMAMGAISKEMIMISNFGYGSGTTVLGCALTLLFFFRTLKKPDWMHFLEWGVALGFGAYTYVPFRVWTPVVLGCMWLWVFWDARERNWNFFRIILGPGLLVCWAFLFLYKNMILSQKSGMVMFLASPMVVILAALLLSVSYGKVFLEGRAKGQGKLWGWATGAFATALVMMPLYFHPHYAEHVSDIFSSFNDSAQKAGPKWGPLLYLLNHFILGHQFMFGRIDDVGRLPAAGDSWFDFYVPACGLLGLAYFFARPGWTKVFLVTLYFVGLVPYMFTFNPHPFRLECMVAPVLLIGAWGLNRLWMAFLQTGYPKAGNISCAILLLFFGGWEVNRNSKLLAEWMAQKGPDSVIADQVEKALPNHRIYLSRFQSGFYSSSQDILCDNKEIFRMNDTNVIDLQPEEQGKDLAIMVYGKDKEVQEKLEKEFPGLPWSSRWIFWQKPDEVPFLVEMDVPFDRLKEEGGLFTPRLWSPSTWRRRFYGRYGMGRGLIVFNELVSHWNDSLPTAYEWDNSTASIEGTWDISNEGEYEFTVTSYNLMWLFLDGKKIIDTSGQNIANKSWKVFLKPGPHKVRMVNDFTSEHRFTVLYVAQPGQGSKVPLDELVAGSPAH